MSKKSFNNKHDQQWEWEETPEVVAAVKQLHATIALNKLRLEELK